MQLPQSPLTIPQAIAREEGYYESENSRAYRNNNPGNIEYGAFARAYGSTHGDPRFAVFPTAIDGFNALAQLLLHHYKGLTVAETIRKWAPPNENNTAAYIRSVCSWTELNSWDIIDTHITTLVEASDATEAKDANA